MREPFDPFMDDGLILGCVDKDSYRGVAPLFHTPHEEVREAFGELRERVKNGLH